jgi:hypothetical protein
VVLPLHLPSPERPRGAPLLVPGLAVLALLVLIDLKGTEESTQFQIVVTALKVLLLVLFLWGGLRTFDATVVRTSIAENIDDVAQIGLTSALVFIMTKRSIDVGTRLQQSIEKLRERATGHVDPLSSSPERPRRTPRCSTLRVYGGIRGVIPVQTTTRRSPDSTRLARPANTMHAQQPGSRRQHVFTASPPRPGE